MTFTEWDLPSQSAGTIPGALFISDAIARGTGDVWYVTREAPWLIRFTPTTPSGSWQGWSLEPTGTTGGLKVTRTGVAFVLLADEIMRIDTRTNTRTRWYGVARSVSDLALDAAGNIYSTSPVARAVGFVQRLVPVGPTDAVMTRWFVGQGVGEAYLSGIAVHPTTGLVYYSEPGTDNIGELNPSATTDNVRKWPVTAVGAAGPGEISIDRSGNVWAVTASGHIVRLRAATNELTSFPIPTPNSIPVGIAADGLIGFTESGTAKIGALLPGGTPVVVSPAVGSYIPMDFPVTGEMDTLTPVSGTAPAVTTFMPATEAGSFIEAGLPSGSSSPQGLDGTGATGGFFYAVGVSPTLNRVGSVVLPSPTP